MPVNENQFAPIFSETSGIVAAYFFGSQVSGKTDRFSDYDFAVLFRDGWQEERARLYITADLMEKAFSAVGQDNADVVDLSTQPLWFQQVVVKTGRVIYETDREKRRVYERELMRQCLEAGLSEYAEDGKMKKQDVQYNAESRFSHVFSFSRFLWAEKCINNNVWVLNSFIHQVPPGGVWGSSCKSHRPHKTFLLTFPALSIKIKHTLNTYQTTERRYVIIG